MYVLAWMFVGLLVAMALSIPIAVALGLGGLIWLALMDAIRFKGAAHAIWNTAANYLLISVPLFILMGEIIQRAEIAQRFYRALSVWVRWMPGGLLHANIGTCALFSAISGSSVATAATIGTAAIPSLMSLGYDRKLLFGSLAAGGTLGIIIPPSIPLIIYAALVEVSLGRLFVAAVIPGILIAVMFSGYIAWRCWRNPQLTSTVQVGDEITARQRLVSLIDIFPIAFLIIVILGGIYLGWATPTEVAAVGVALALIIAAAYRRLTWALFAAAVDKTTRFTAVLLFVIIGAQIFSYALFSWGITRTVAEWVGSLSLPSIAILVAIILVYLILGMFIDSISMMLLTLSVVFPIIIKLGYDPIWFGVVLVLLLEIGLITPPVGMNLFTIQGIVPNLTSTMEVARGALPFVFLLVFGIALLIAFPQLALWLPGQMFR